MQIDKVIKFAILLAVVLGISFSTVSWVFDQYKLNANDYSPISSFVWNLIFIIGLSTLVEKFLPLLSISKLEWIYHVRPLGQLSFGRFSPILQLSVFALFGLLVGAANGHFWIWLMISLLARLVTGLFKRKSIPNLLSAGRRKILSEASLNVLDSALVADSTTVAHLKWIDRPPTGNYLILTFRRFLRRPHIALTMLVVISFTFSFSNVFGNFTPCLFFLLWSILGADVARCADFSKLKGPNHLKVVTLIVHGLFALAIMLIITGTIQMLPYGILILPSILWTGIVRSRARRVDQITYIDSGVIGPISPEIIKFYLSGLLPTVVVSIIIVSLLN